MHNDLKLLQGELERALSGLDDRQTQLRPESGLQASPRGWNVQQIVGHLLLTYAATLAAVEARLAKGSATKAQPSLAQRVGQLTVIGLGWFPQGRRAPAGVMPEEDAAPLSGEALCAAVASALARMDDRIEDAERLFGRRRKAISHMILGPLNVGQWRRFHLVHGRHHIRQMAAIRAEYGI
jgi:DinB superfamily